MQDLVNKPNFDQKDAQTLSGYVLEALRTYTHLSEGGVHADPAFVGLDPPFRGTYQQALQATTLGQQSLTPKEPVFLNVAAANLDVSPRCQLLCRGWLMGLLQPQAFRDPQTVDPTRPKDRYLASDGPARCLGTDFSAKVRDSLAHYSPFFPC